jgi:3-deoxy-D-manno-octulosonic-acid transferase
MKFLLIIHFKNVLKNCLNLYTRKNFKGGVAMERKQKQTQTQQQQAQQGIIFVTFPCKVSQETARQILAELRTRFPAQTLIFVPRPPAGKKLLINIAGILTIVTIPYKQEDTPKEAPKHTREGFTLGELIRNKNKT